MKQFTTPSISALKSAICTEFPNVEIQSVVAFSVNKISYNIDQTCDLDGFAVYRVVDNDEIYEKGWYYMVVRYSSSGSVIFIREVMNQEGFEWIDDAKDFIASQGEAVYVDGDTISYFVK